MELLVIQFITLFLLLLVSGVFWGPWLALHRTMEIFSAEELIPLVKIMGQNLAKPMRILMPVCILMMILSAVIYPQKDAVAFYLIIIAIVLLISALIITLAIELPIVNQIREWDAESNLPLHWEAVRNRWVRFHVVRLCAALAGFAFFLAATLHLM